MIQLTTSKKLHMLCLSIERVTGVTIEELRGKTREHRVSLYRMMFYLIAHEKHKIKWREIGEYTNRDHSTCLTGAQRVKAVIEVDETAAHKFTEIFADLSLPSIADDMMQRVERVQFISEELEKMREAIQMLTERVQQLEQVAGVEGGTINWKEIGSIC